MTTDAKMINHLWTHKTQDHPFLSDEELVIDRAEGVWVWTEQGKKLLDGFAGLAVVNVGHGRREIAEAIAEQTVRLAYYPTTQTVLQSARGGAGREARVAHARRPALHDVRGERLRGQRALDADRAAVLARHRQARQAQGDLAQGRLPRRHHGDLRGLRPAQSLARPTPRSRCPASPRWRRRIPSAIWRAGTEAELIARRIAEMREAIVREGPDTVSAVILEPVLSSGGFIMPPIGWLRAVRALCDELDVLMIADEVITGFGRTGRWFAVEHDQVVPDLMSVAKGITSGYIPLSASIARGRLADAFSDTTTQENVHPNTYAAHPVACAAALANLRIMEQDKLVANAEAMGTRLLEGLRERGGQAPDRGRGPRARPPGLRGLRAARRLRQAARRQAGGRARPQGVGPRRHHLRARHRAAPGAAALHHRRRGGRAGRPSSPTASTRSSATSRRPASAQPRNSRASVSHIIAESLRLSVSTRSLWPWNMSG